VVIAWMPVSQRSSTIAQRLGFDLVLIGRSGFRRAWTAPLAYPWSAIRTIATLVRRRPRAAIVAAPPFVAALVALPFLAALRAPLAIDAHTGALLDRRWRWSVPILAWLGRRSVAVVVTLPSLEEPLVALGVPTLVIPDPLPRLSPGDRAPERGVAADRGPADGPAADPAGGRPSVVAVCGWGLDEPIDALVASAEGRPWHLTITGRPSRAVPTPPNVRLAGFLDHAAYVALLAAADVVVVLTERDDTLLSGAWEAIALERPLVLSGTRALRSTFGEEVTYVEPDAAAIAAGIDATLADETAATRVAGLRVRFAADNDAALARLAERLR
jgi:glycosyltransferase involved in cell wall biosynthesis